MGTPEFWVLVAFVIFLGLLVYLGVPGKILGALDNRAVKIRAELDEARALREEASRVLADYARKREQAEREAEQLIADAKAEAERVAADAKVKAEQFVARRTAQAEQKIAFAEAQAVSEVRSAAADAAVEAASRVLGAQAQGPLGDKLFDKGLSDVRAKLN
ncbi:ATP F0F1 synthase subunit B [Methylopila turkensis]|uniref:ATP synthase subunit b n=1 Tax=Methylopila turkensis TaxID=1437816 RepID=A0A9W6N7G7_9HYPH|nr:ATP F0F1 synthase subunit B [Methylopila turkensis]GLK80351.1 ATP synthase subunit b [Methylopila turkensis]